MNEQQIIRTSKFLSRVLRHDPSAIGITLDSQGWVEIDQLLTQLARKRRPLDREHLNQLVETNNKKRFIFSEDGKRIRANQGHSIKIDLGLAPTPPPETLYHGTATRFLDSIRDKGLIPGSRQHVHLSDNLQTAIQVGSRHGKPIILAVSSALMHQNKHHFYLSENDVWLTDSVPVEFIQFPSSSLNEAT